jgi:hypothetical protein
MTRNRSSRVLWVAALAMLAAPAHAADVDGTWHLVFQTEAGAREASLEVSTDGEAATATMGETELRGTYTAGVLVLEGEHHAAEAGYSNTLKLEGRLAEGELRGESSWGEHGSTFVGTRTEE